MAVYCLCKIEHFDFKLARDPTPSGIACRFAGRYTEEDLSA
jgi:hypothetical protein